MQRYSRLWLLTFLILVMMLGGCATTSAITHVTGSKSGFDGAVYGGESVDLDPPTPGADLYRLFEQGATGLVSIASLRDNVDDLATKFCARKGKAVHPVRETTSTPPYVLGNFPRVEWQFECVDSPSQTGHPIVPSSEKLTQLERLKKLLDGGALTVAEFDVEKAKILAAP